MGFIRENRGRGEAKPERGRWSYEKNGENSTGCIRSFNVAAGTLFSKCRSDIVNPPDYGDAEDRRYSEEQNDNE